MVAATATEESGASAEADPLDASMISITSALNKLVEDSRKYHTRAQHRENVIDGIHAELEQLRRGERRGMLRPLLTEICRLRDDLLRQADQLPADYDAARTGILLRSYAESIEIALADNGVNSYEPKPGDVFEPRAQRGVGKLPTHDQTSVGRVASSRKCGYLDIETNMPISAAEVTVFVSASTAVHPADVTAPTEAPSTPVATLASAPEVAVTAHNAPHTTMPTLAPPPDQPHIGPTTDDAPTGV